VWNGVSVDIASDATAIPYRDLLRGGVLVFEAQATIAYGISKKTQATTATRAVWNGVSVDIASDATAIPYRDLLRGGDLVFEA
jgi:hypothetical protein